MKTTILFASLVLAFAASTVNARPAATPGQIQKGVASYYHDSLHGLKTASGKRYDRNALSAAHKTLPLGTKVRVTDVKTGKDIVVRINDRGPFKDDRVIDLSLAAAKQIGLIARGTGQVQLEILERGSQGAPVRE